jgi:hypothetical protein
MILPQSTADAARQRGPFRVSDIIAAMATPEPAKGQRYRNLPYIATRNF